MFLLQYYIYYIRNTALYTFFIRFRFTNYFVINKIFKKYYIIEYIRNTALYTVCIRFTIKYIYNYFVSVWGFVLWGVVLDFI